MGKSNENPEKKIYFFFSYVSLYSIYIASRFSDVPLMTAMSASWLTEPHLPAASCKSLFSLCFFHIFIKLKKKRNHLGKLPCLCIASEGKKPATFCYFNIPREALSFLCNLPYKPPQPCTTSIIYVFLVHIL